jgi:hypothetical protein
MPFVGSTSLPSMPFPNRVPRQNDTQKICKSEPQHPQCSRNRGCLLHNNPGGDPSMAPRCGAKTRQGQKCRAPAMRNRKTGEYTRCRMHGGASTGPKTPEGIERCRKAGWKHGLRSAEAIAERAEAMAERLSCRAELRNLEKLLRGFKRPRN